MKLVVAMLIVLLMISLAVNWVLFNKLPLGEQAPAVPGSQFKQLVAGQNKAPLVPNSSSQQTSSLVEQKQSALSKAKNWLTQGEYQRLAEFLQRYLRQHPDDLDFLLLEAELIRRTAPIGEALARYYGLLDLPLSEAQSTAVLAKIDQLALDNIRTLSGIKSWDVLSAFLEPLWQFAPNKREYILALAEAYAWQALRSPMENVLASLLPNDPQAERIRNLLPTQQPNQISDLPEETISTQIDAEAISLRAIGDHFAVKTRINGMVFDLVIDTGASTTLLTEQAFQRFAKRYSSRFVGEYTVNTAGGQVVAPLYQVDSISIADHEVVDAGLLVLPMPAFEQADGLLGMNFLREFNFRIDQDAAMLHLD